MKKTIYTFFAATLLMASCLLLFSTQHVNAQAWAHSSVSAGNEEGRDVATDAAGNVYVCGFYDSTGTFGSTNVTTNGLKDAYLAKYDNAGNFIWVRTAGSTGDDIAWGLVIDNANNIVVTGLFNSSITFGTTVLTSAGGADLFVVKYDAAGTVIWANSYGGTLDEELEEGSPISKDDSGNVFITGAYYSLSFPLGSFTLTNTNIAWEAGFVFKLSSSGTVIWANQFASDGSWSGLQIGFGEGIATDNNGNCYVVGDYLYGGMLGMSSYSNAENGCILKYDINGTLIWSQPIHCPSGSGNGGNIRVVKVVTDDSANVYVNGWYLTSTMDAGGITLTNNGAAGTHEAFVAKYDSSGTVQWAVSFGGVDLEYVRAIKLDADNHLWCEINSYSPSISFGSFNFAVNDSDMYLTKLNSSDGSVLDAFQYGSTGYDAANGIAIDGASQLFITGTYSSPSLTLNGITLTNSGLRDMFVARLGSTVGVPLINNGTMLTVSPNPFTNEIRIKRAYNQTGTQNILSLCDITGKEILRQIISGEETIINTDKIAAGFYLLHYANEKKSENFKVVKR